MRGRRENRRGRLLLAVWLCLLWLGGCGQADTPAELPTAAELQEETIGVLLGSGADMHLSTAGYDLLRYETVDSALFALSADAVAALSLEASTVRQITATKEGYTTLPLPEMGESYGMVVTPEHTALLEQANAFLAEYLASHLAAEMEERWLTGDLSAAQMPAVVNPGTETLTVAVYSAYPPFSYLGEGGALLGFDVELAYRLGAYLGRQVVFYDASFYSLFPALEAGKADIIISAVAKTPEREESYLFSSIYYYNPLVLLIRDQAPTAAAQSGGLWQTLSRSVYNNVIREQRYLLIFQGIQATLLLSASAALVGSALAVGLCLLRHSRLRSLAALARCYQALIQGVPVVVLLMIFCYVFFKGSGINNTLVVALAFAAYFAAYAADSMEQGLRAVEPGQYEAAWALGYPRRLAFRRLILPQAVSAGLPAYKSALISLVQTTSMAGYVAVTDLTKVSDIIRSRTYDAFFPLLLTAAIYYLLAKLLTWLLDMAIRRRGADQRERRIRR